MQALWCLIDLICMKPRESWMDGHCLCACYVCIEALAWVFCEVFRCFWWFESSWFCFVACKVFLVH